MELIFPLLIIGVVIFLTMNVFRRGKKTVVKKAPEKYVFVKERETRQRVFNVPNDYK